MRTANGPLLAVGRETQISRRIKKQPGESERLLWRVQGEAACEWLSVLVLVLGN